MWFYTLECETFGKKTIEGLDWEWKKSGGRE